LIIALPIGILISLELDKMFKIIEFGVYFIYAYLIFILYIFFENIIGDRINHSDDIKLFSWDIGNPAGLFSLAFTMHNGVITILR